VPLDPLHKAHPLGIDATDPDHIMIPPIGKAAAAAVVAIVVAKAVVAICVLLVPPAAVGANGEPVKVGLLLSALLAIAAAMAVNSVSSSAPLTTLLELPAGNASFAVKLVALV
jgi:hypothetical protein